MSGQDSKGTTRCTRCLGVIAGTKFATEDAGVLCHPCARESHGIPNPWLEWRLHERARRWRE